MRIARRSADPFLRLLTATDDAVGPRPGVHQRRLRRRPAAGHRAAAATDLRGWNVHGHDAFMLGVITNAARHEPEAVAALRAGRDDRVNRLLRLPLPEPYVPTRLESARDRLRTAEAAKAAREAASPSPSRSPAEAQGQAEDRRARRSPNARRPRTTGARTAHAADRPARRSGHHGGRQRQPSRRARPLEGQRYG